MFVYEPWEKASMAATFPSCTSTGNRPRTHPCVITAQHIMGWRPPDLAYACREHWSLSSRTRCKEWLTSLLWPAQSFFVTDSHKLPAWRATASAASNASTLRWPASVFPTLQSDQFDMPEGSVDDERRPWCAIECKRPHLQGEIYGWSDASFADIKSSDGSHCASSISWLFSSNGSPISWRSTKTPLIALNVAESEIIDQSSACQETATASA
jgi:hypothetical protein